MRSSRAFSARQPLGEQVDEQRRGRRRARSAPTRSAPRAARAGGWRCSRGPSPRRGAARSVRRLLAQAFAVQSRSRDRAPCSARPHAEATVRTRMESRELDYDLPPELIAQHPAERRDESRLLVFDRATGDVQHRSSATCPELPPDDARRRQRHARRAGADPDRAPARRGAAAGAASTATVGGARTADAAAARRAALRPGRAARAPRRGPLARPARRRAGRARRRCRRTSRSRSPTPSATRRSTRGDRAPPPRRRPACTSRTSCSRGSTSSG